jgi:hypothetical protein
MSTSSFWIAPIFAGFLGTTALTVLVCLPRWLGMRNVDMVRALGALLSPDRDPERGLMRGLLVHYVIGILIAWFYLVAFRAFGFQFSALTGALVGIIHGGLAMIVVDRIVLRRQPRALDLSPEAHTRIDDQARAAEIAQLIGHILYGAIVAGVYQVLQTHPRVG